METSRLAQLLTRNPDHYDLYDKRDVLMLIENSPLGVAIEQIHEDIKAKCRTHMQGNPWNESQAWHIAKAQGKLEFMSDFHAAVENLIIKISNRIKEDESHGKTS